VISGEYSVSFEESGQIVNVPKGTLLVDAARQAGLEIAQPCGGQGRCGRCVVQVKDGLVRRRSVLRLSVEDVAQGFALACQTVVEGDLLVSIPPQEKVERRLTTDRTAAEVTVPPSYDWRTSQSIQRVRLSMHTPTMDDQVDDWGRLQNALRNQANFTQAKASLHTLRMISSALREGNWDVTAVLEVQDGAFGSHPQERLITLIPGHMAMFDPLWGAAVDIGTTTVTVWLVDLATGNVVAQASEYNAQIARGEDVISRIVYAGRADGAAELRDRVVETINTLLDRACQRARAGDDEDGPSPEEIVKVTVSGNTTMIHLLLDLPAANIRLSPFIPAVNVPPELTAREVGFNTHPEATVDCLPGVASYVGSDITAGVLASGMDESSQITLFIDVGTNGEIVLGSRDWLVACACSAGPAFEGAGVVSGMRATRGAIEEVWIASPGSENPYEPTYRVIGNVKPRGLCGSALISLIAEMFLTGLVDKGGNINTSLNTPRVRQGEHGSEYVVAWASETGHGQDIAITRVDIDNLLRAKAAIFAGFNVLAESVGIPLQDVQQLLVGGSFGRYINIEKAVQIGLLPDIPWERVHFLGNTSVRGAYYTLLDREARQRIQDIASRMTYIELSADNTFYESFMSALFLPHTEMWRFPSVEALFEGDRSQDNPAASPLHI
jgi:uncharacterized 2Fe-2S/4Fe-4S cluster protein (DUF4445 family)